MQYKNNLYVKTIHKRQRLFKILYRAAGKLKGKDNKDSNFYSVNSFLNSLLNLDAVGNTRKEQDMIPDTLKLINY